MEIHNQEEAHNGEQPMSINGIGREQRKTGY